MNLELLAIKSQKQSLVIVHETNNLSGEGAALGNLGGAHYTLGNYSKSIEYDEKRLLIARKTKDRSGEGKHLGIWEIITIL